MPSRNIALATALLLLPIQAAPAAVRWHHDLAAAQQVAEQHQRLVLLHFYSEWCAPCQRLKRELYPRPDVAAAISANYVPVKIDGVRFRQLAAEYQVDRFPTEIITDASGNVLLRTVTPPDAERYIQLLNQVASSQRGSPAGDSWAGSHPSHEVHEAERTHRAQATPELPSARPPHSPLDRHAPWGPQPPVASQPGAQQDHSNWGEPTQPPQGPPNPAWHSSRETPRAETTASSSGPPAATNPPTTHSQQGVTHNPFVASAASPAAPEPLEGHAAELPLALDGYCPVALADRDTWEPGDARWGALHRGRIYLFQSEEHQRRFQADPDRFSPVLSGVDPLRYLEQGQVALGQRGHGMWFRGKMYLFADEASLERFQRRPDYYAQKSHELMVHGRYR